MKKIYTINGIDCANCALKLEDKINKIEGINEASINFMMGKLTIEASTTTDEEFEEVMKKAREIIKRMEPDAKIIE